MFDENEIEEKINETIMQMERCGYEFVEDTNNNGVKFKKMKKAKHNGKDEVNFKDWNEVNGWLDSFGQYYKIED